MKKYSVMLFGVFFLICPLLYGQEIQKYESIASDPRNILDYYLLYSGFELNAYTHELESFEQRKKYLIPDEFRGVFVDKRNGYLKIEETDEFGSTNTNITMALFFSDSGECIVGITECFGADDMSYYHKFIKYDNRIWIDVTPDVLPEFRFSMFCDNKKALLDSGILKPDLFIVYNVELPHFGTKLTVTPVLLDEQRVETRLYDLAECNDAAVLDSLQKVLFVDNKLVRYYDFIRARKYKSIQLSWNRSSEKFELAEKN